MAAKMLIPGAGLKADGWNSHQNTMPAITPAATIA